MAKTSKTSSIYSSKGASPALLLVRLAMARRLLPPASPAPAARTELVPVTVALPVVIVPRPVKKANLLLKYFERFDRDQEQWGQIQKNG